MQHAYSVMDALENLMIVEDSIIINFTSGIVYDIHVLVHVVGPGDHAECHDLITVAVHLWIEVYMYDDEIFADTWT